MKVRYYEKRPGAWHLDFRDATGKRCRPYGGATEAEAQRNAPRVIAEALAAPAVPVVPAAATVPVSNGMTFEQAFKRGMKTRPKWMQSKDKKGLEETYGKVVAYWGAHEPVSKATREAVKDWRAVMLEEDGKRAGKKLSASTMNHRFSMLNVLLEVADCAPHGVKFLSVDGTQRMRRAREEELDAVVTWCMANWERKGATTLADMVLVGLDLVARRGELLNLRWTDVYFELKQASLRHTKNGKGRTVPIPDRALRILERRREYGGDGPFMVGVSTSQLTKLWQDARKALGLADDHEFVFHVATRHEGASRLGDQGASAFQIKAVMGNSIKAADIYVKPAAESLRGLMEGVSKGPQTGGSH